VKNTRTALTALLLLVLTGSAAATVPPEMSQIWDLHGGIKNVATALGVLMIVYSGVRWIVATSPDERDDAKKTIVYVIIGLLVIAVTKELVQALYCQTLQGTSYGAGVC